LQRTCGYVLVCAVCALKQAGHFLASRRSAPLDEEGFHVAEFDADPDTFRYLAWTNSRVHQVNELIRASRYGANMPTPFLPGESALFRAPVIIDESTIFANNQEARVVAIERSTFTHAIEKADGVSRWTASGGSQKYCNSRQIKCIKCNFCARINVSLAKHSSYRCLHAPNRVHRRHLAFGSVWGVRWCRLTHDLGLLTHEVGFYDA
jgi:hypothetical protein